MINEKSTRELIKNLAAKLPKFPDGRINYSQSDIAPVVTIFIESEGKILLLKRSEKMRNYPGKWNAVTGYLDEVVPIKEKVIEELREETGITEKEIVTMHYGEPYKMRDEQLRKTWIIHPVLVKTSVKPEIVLDQEHTECLWIKSEELFQFDTPPKLDESLRRALTRYRAK